MEANDYKLKYLVVTAKSAEDLVVDVNYLIEFENFQPLGGVCCDSTYGSFGRVTMYHQAMIKEIKNPR